MILVTAAADRARAPSGAGWATGVPNTAGVRPIGRDTAEVATRLGVSDFVTKPFNLEEAAWARVLFTEL